MLRGTLAVIVLVFIFSGTARAGVCNIPLGTTIQDYHPNGATCDPDMPSTDFGPKAGTNYPICGVGRVAAAGDGSYFWSNFSSEDLPRTNAPAYTYPFPAGPTYQNTSSQAPSMPVYGFPPGSRCYCKGSGFVPATQALTYKVLSPITSGGLVRQYPVTYDVINSQNTAGAVRYSPVPISTAMPQLDGRDYANFSTGNAPCGCPNINESLQQNDASDVVDGAGSYCAPTVNITNLPSAGNQSVVVLEAFSNPVAQNALVLNPASEVYSGASIVPTIQLPSSGSDQGNLTLYNRKIWACAAPYELDPITANCIFTAGKHACDNGAGGGPPSAVDDTITPPLADGQVADPARFDNTVNKKLACCLNAFHTGGYDLFSKFDCIANSDLSKYASFDALWASSDDPLDGGQLNAMILSTGSQAGVPSTISGFYSLTGAHCDQFSEFAFPPGGAIKHYRVDPLLAATSQLSVGNTPVTFGTDILLPTSAAYTSLNAQVTGTWGKTFPSTANDYRQCPILVRTAMTASCPSMTTVPNALTTINAATFPANGPRCAHAGSVQLHLRIEQVYEITGAAAIKPVDSIVELNLTSAVDVTKIIQTKIGSLCPPYTTKRGDSCVY